MRPGTSRHKPPGARPLNLLRNPHPRIPPIRSPRPRRNPPGVHPRNLVTRCPSTRPRRSRQHHRLPGICPHSPRRRPGRAGGCLPCHRPVGADPHNPVPCRSVARPHRLRQSRKVLGAHPPKPRVVWLRGHGQSRKLLGVRPPSRPAVRRRVRNLSRELPVIRPRSPLPRGVTTRRSGNHHLRSRRNPRTTAFGVRHLRNRWGVERSVPVRSTTRPPLRDGCPAGWNR